jgi:ATP-dependent protease Clp ATPase subunit
MTYDFRLSAFVCAFCGKDPQQTEGMVASRKAMICRDCICYLYEMISEDDATTG